MAFEFPIDLDPATLFGDPERSYIIVGVSMLLPYLEPYLIRTMKEAKKHVTDPQMVSDMERFSAQEGQHFKEHMRFNEVIRKSFPGLTTLEAEPEADTTSAFLPPRARELLVSAASGRFCAVAPHALCPAR